MTTARQPAIEESTLEFALHTPRWVMIALLSRMARHAQGSLCRITETNRDTLLRIDQTIAGIEESALNASICGNFTELASIGRDISKHLREQCGPFAASAALCAAEAANAVANVTDHTRLLQSVKATIECAYAVVKPERHADLERDIREIGALGVQLQDADPAPSQMLNYVLRQCVHEVGHALAASLLMIPFHEVWIVYYPRFEPVFYDEEIDPDFADELNRRRLMYAAGGAAEDLVLGSHWTFAVEADLDGHAKCGGTDFCADMDRVKSVRHFSVENIRGLAELLERRYRNSGEMCFPSSLFSEAIEHQGIHICSEELLG